MPRLTDSRDLTMTDAEQLLEDIAHATVRVAKTEAAVKLRIAKLQTELEALTTLDRKVVESKAAQLALYIEAHPEQFSSPRMHRTDFGEFGLRKVSDIYVSDREALLATLLGNGYTDCIRTRHTAVKAALKKRLAAGEAIPGCELRIAHLAKYDIAKHLLVDSDDIATG